MFLQGREGRVLDGQLGDAVLEHPHVRIRFMQLPAQIGNFGHIQSDVIDQQTHLGAVENFGQGGDHFLFFVTIQVRSPSVKFFAVNFLL